MRICYPPIMYHLIAQCRYQSLIAVFDLTLNLIVVLISTLDQRRSNPMLIINLFQVIDRRIVRICYPP